jgi:hypothetical protein
VPYRAKCPQAFEWIEPCAEQLRLLDVFLIASRAAGTSDTLKNRAVELAAAFALARHRQKHGC